MQRSEADLVLLLQLFLELLNTLAEGVLGTLQLGNHGFSLFKLSAQLTFRVTGNGRSTIILRINLSRPSSDEEPHHSRSVHEPFDCCCR